MFLTILRLVSRLVLKLIAAVHIEGITNLPPEGEPVIIVSNHVGRMDAMLVFILADRRDIIMFVAEKYQKSALVRYFARHLDAIWLNRYDMDLVAVRTAHQRLKRGGLLAMSPEGTRSKSGSMIAGKPGAAFLAARTGVPVIPVGIMGTEDAQVKARLRRLRRVRITIHIGDPFQLPPYDRHNRDAYLAAATEEIMCRIAACLPESYHGVYAHHPRLLELQAA